MTISNCTSEDILEVFYKMKIYKFEFEYPTAEVIVVNNVELVTKVENRFNQDLVITM